MSHQGNWSCSSCSKEIKELPFEPRGTDNLKCRECHQKSQGDKSAKPQNDRKIFKGEWTCGVCQAKITELPFEPRHTDGLKCRNCLRK